MNSCRNLKQGDKCDKCGEGIMRPTGRRFVLHKKINDEYKPSEDLIELECDRCGHKHINLSLYEYISLK
jgi:ribosomal protein S27E